MSQLGYYAEKKKMLLDSKELIKPLEIYFKSSETF